MRLQDSVAASRLPLLVETERKRLFTLPNASDIAGALRATPIRYVLDDAVAATTARAAFCDPERLLGCLELLRVPASQIWLEWCERGRQAVLAEIGIDTTSVASRNGRAGMLVTGDESGRRGRIQVVWESQPDGSEPPDVSPFALAYDFDDATFGAQADERSAFAICFPEDEAASRLVQHVRFELSPAWHAYYETVCPSPSVFRDVVRQNLIVVLGDFQFLTAFCLLLQAKNAVELAPIQLDRLNAARAKRGREALLDHIEVKAHLDEAMPAYGGLEHGGERSPSRLHFVSGHFVRRGQNVFWRRAHLRGNVMRGVIAARTITVLPARTAAAA